MAKKKGTLRGNRPTPEATAVKQWKAWEMRCANHTLMEIGAALKVNHTTVMRWLEKLRKEDYEAHAATREQHKIDQTRQLEHLASQAMRAWEKSKEPLPRVRETTNADGETVRVTDLIEREGNVSYLHTVIKCMADIRAIWGFDVLPAAQDVGSTVAAAIRNLADKVKQYAAEVEKDGASGPASGDGGTDPERVGDMPE